MLGIELDAVDDTQSRGIGRCTGGNKCLPGPYFSSYRKSVICCMHRVVDIKLNA